MAVTTSQPNEILGTTQVLNEAGVKTAQRQHLSDIPEGLLQATRVGYTQMGIHDFLAKPVRLASVNWTSADLPGGTLANVELPQDAFSFPVYSEKVSGFLGFRATTVVRLQVNGTKFQQGRLLMVFIPQGNVASSWPGSRVRSLTAATQLPRVELDLSTDTEVIMEIPYVSPTPYYNFADNTGPIGRVYVLVYGQLTFVTGADSVFCTLWCHFKDVDLVTPAVAQMSGKRPKVKKNVNPSEQELQASTAKGPISSGLGFMAKGASSFKDVPMLAPIAGPASWVLNCLSGVASIFGYSKPVSEDPVTKVQSVYQFNMQNYNGLDYLPQMGLEATNKLSVLPGFAGTDVDEMSLNHLCQIPSFVSAAFWLSTDAPDSVVSTLTVHPNTGVGPGTVSGWDILDFTPMAFFSNMFYYWRGSMVLTIKFVKTQFHSGRLMVTYNPTSVAPTVEQTSFLLREIVDLRETSEFRFVIPFTSTTQYRKTNAGTVPLVATDNIGTVTIHVLNELVAPDTVAQEVALLYEWSAGPDFELACPAPSFFEPLYLE